MKSNINELELNILNNVSNKEKKTIFHYIGTGIYYTFKIILEIIYIITCIICTTIEAIAWVLTLGVAAKAITKRKRKRW